MKNLVKNVLTVIVLVLFLTSCNGSGKSTTESSHENSNIASTSWYNQNKGWGRFVAEDRETLSIYSDNVHVINGVPVALDLSLLEWQGPDGIIRQLAYLLLRDASGNENERNPSIDPRMNMVDLNLDGKSLTLYNERPIDNTVTIAIGDEAVELIRQLTGVNKTKVTLKVENGETLTYTFSTLLK